MKSNDSTIRIFRYLLVNCMVLVFFSCRSQDPSRKSTEIQPSSDSVVREIPKFFQRKEWTRYFSDLQSSLNIRSLQNGANEWQIRLWVAHGVYDYKDSTQLIVFTKEAGIVTGMLYTYVTQDRQKSDTTYIGTAGRFVSLFPKSGWTRFLDSLNKLAIFTLPDYTKLKGYFLANDSYGVTLEAATKNTYRIYEYPDYEQHVDKIPEAEKVFKTLKLIEDEFKIKVVY
jgi:hypothetical protein